MPQSDHENQVNGETDEDPPKNDAVESSGDIAGAPADSPPESFWLSKDAEYDWFDRNAFYERKESTKGNTNNNSNPANPNPNSNSSSQRFSVTLKSKPSFIGLPKTQKATFADSKRRTCRPANLIRIVPKRSESAGKSVLVEPGSPKVSCMGRVRSKRARRRSNSLKRKAKPVEKSRTGGENQKTGFYFKLMGMFRSKKGPKKLSKSGSRRVVEEDEDEEEEAVSVEPVRKSVEPLVEPPGLGGMKRFVSGRRSESWGSDDFNRGS